MTNFRAKSGGRIFDGRYVSYRVDYKSRCYMDQEIRDILGEKVTQPGDLCDYKSADSILLITDSLYPDAENWQQQWVEALADFQAPRGLVAIAFLERTAFRYRWGRVAPKNARPSDQIKNLQSILKNSEKLIRNIDKLTPVIFEERLHHDFRGQIKAAKRSLLKLEKLSSKQSEIYGRQVNRDPARHRRDDLLLNTISKLCYLRENFLGLPTTTGTVNAATGYTGGEIISFLQSCLGPLGVKKSDKALRENLRTVIVHRNQYQNYFD